MCVCVLSIVKYLEGNDTAGICFQKITGKKTKHSKTVGEGGARLAKILIIDDSGWVHEVQDAIFSYVFVPGNLPKEKYFKSN